MVRGENSPLVLGRGGAAYSTSDAAVCAAAKEYTQSVEHSSGPSRKRIAAVAATATACIGACLLMYVLHLARQPASFEQDTGDYMTVRALSGVTTNTLLSFNPDAPNAYSGWTELRGTSSSSSSSSSHSGGAVHKSAKKQGHAKAVKLPPRDRAAWAHHGAKGSGSPRDSKFQSHHPPAVAKTLQKRAPHIREHGKLPTVLAPPHDPHAAARAKAADVAAAQAEKVAAAAVRKASKSHKASKGKQHGHVAHGKAAGRARRAALSNTAELTANPDKALRRLGSQTGNLAKDREAVWALKRKGGKSGSSDKKKSDGGKTASLKGAENVLKKLTRKVREALGRQQEAVAASVKEIGRLQQLRKKEERKVQQTDETLAKAEARVRARAQSVVANAGKAAAAVSIAARSAEASNMAARGALSAERDALRSAQRITAGVPSPAPAPTPVTPAPAPVVPAPVAVAPAPAPASPPITAAELRKRLRRLDRKLEGLRRQTDAGLGSDSQGAAGIRTH